MNRYSQTNLLRGFAALLAAVQKGDPEIDLNLAEEPLVIELEEAHAHALYLIARRQALRAAIREMTAELNETVATGHHRMKALRGLLRVKLGPRSAQLARFGVGSAGRRRGGVRELGSRRRAS